MYFKMLRRAAHGLSGRRWRIGVKQVTGNAMGLNIPLIQAISAGLPHLAGAAGALSGEFAAGQAP